MSGSDSYTINHPHLSPAEAILTADRDHSNRIRQPIEGLENLSYGFSVNRPKEILQKGSARQYGQPFAASTKDLIKFMSILHIDNVKFKKANDLDDK
ncbi:uncharacterized protein L199_007708 [Kwoniella botswanensis]|uniref:uncharacterized protein n=1 Tax=Kwoniella botswanensis TaxID=1268659 RepID=UPI00315D6907